MVKKLLIAGADPSAFNHQKITPIEIAIDHHQYEVLRTLVGFQRKQELIEFALYVAIDKNQPEMAEFLIKEFAVDVNGAFAGEPYLRLAVIKQHYASKAMLMSQKNC